MFSIRITKPDGQFHAYLSHRNRTAWSKRQCQRHIAEAKTLPHFVAHKFVIEPDKRIG
jgi:hypothetical protein